MDLKDFNYDLPTDLIGQKAIEPRDSCKLMVLDRKTNHISHRIFKDLASILNEKYVLVINDTKVFPARLFGKKTSGGKVEILLLRQTGQDSFDAIGKGGLKPGQEIVFDDSLVGKIENKNEAGEISIKFNLAGIDLLTAIDEQGKTPLPPYIHSDEKEKTLREQYQTVYANEKGSAAAPTAGLHFTKELLKELEERGVSIKKVTLHVGLGTFRPVTNEQIASKTLHVEHFSVSESTATSLNLAKKEGKKIIAVGTTSCRVLETLSSPDGTLRPGEGDTNIFIQPGYKFKFVDGLITNFHLPETSLLMLVTALTCSPNSPTIFKEFSETIIGKAYAEAVKNRYLFFSFGDAMLIL